MRPRKIAIILAFLSVAALLPATIAEQGEPTRNEPRQFSGSYTLALGWSNEFNVQTIQIGDSTSVGLMAAVVTCTETGERGSSSAGGTCAPTYVDPGEVIDVVVSDTTAPEVRFMACVDGDGDGICRPEFPNDRIYIEPCNDQDNRLTVPHKGPHGTLDIYVLNGVGTLCVPVQGVVIGQIEDRPQCSDLQDNDGNGATDFPFDPNCDDPFDDTERPPECSDGIDNDGDGPRDFPQDPSCSSPSDDSEAFPPQCSDGVNNGDGDGWVDYPNDPGCSSPSDNSEGPNPACSDGIDNNGNGRVDYPSDPGCDSPRDTTEWSPECSDLKDNDRNGRVDYPNDPGCSSPSDTSERPVRVN